jgi:hypothetical protein
VVPVSLVPLRVVTIVPSFVRGGGYRDGDRAHRRGQDRDEEKS